MAIQVNLDVMMARRKMKMKDLAKLVDISPTNLSLLKNGHVRGVRFATLSTLCKALDCQPADLLEYKGEEQ